MCLHPGSLQVCPGVVVWWAVALLVMQGRVGWVPNAPHHILVLEDEFSLLAKGKDTWDSEGIVPLSPVPPCPCHGPCSFDLHYFTVIGFYFDVCMSLSHHLVVPGFVLALAYVLSPNCMEVSSCRKSKISLSGYERK